MTQNLPFMNAYGKIKDVLEAIVTASVPPRFTQDFLETKLGFTSSSIRPVISLLKKLGLLAGDGTPTDLYKDFRADSNRGAIFATAIKSAYQSVFDANEYAYRLQKKGLEDIFIRLTGAERGSSTVSAYVGTFQALCLFADFESGSATVTHPAAAPVSDTVAQNADVSTNIPIPTRVHHHKTDDVGIGMNLSYTINLNLPETKDVEVFNAIFESLREKLLR